MADPAVTPGSIYRTYAGLLLCTTLWLVCGPLSAQAQAPKPPSQPVLKKAPPWKPPYEELPAPSDPKPVIERLGNNRTAIWLTGDVLTIAHRADEPNVSITGGLQLPMKRIEGTDVWVLRLKMPDWDKAFFSYTFISADHPPRGRITFEKWYGRQAPQKPNRAAELAGRIEEKTVHSDALAEDRRLTIYLPPNAPRKDLPAFFLADGQSCPGFARVLEPLIKAGRVRPCAIVGVHSASQKPGSTEDRRAEEYLSGYNPDVFAKHMVFFAREVPAYVEREFGISAKAEDHAVIGFSNGGGFAFDAAVDYPEVFGHSLPFSPSHGLTRRARPNSQALPDFFIAGGELEYFGVGARQCYDDVARWPAKATLKMYKAGHDPEMWEMAFAEYAPRVFDTKSAGLEQG